MASDCSFSYNRQLITGDSDNTECPAYVANIQKQNYINNIK